MSELTWHMVGGVGAALILLGFIRINIGKWNNKSLLYELDNLVGASLLVAYTFHKGAYPTLVLNIVWVAAAIYGLSSLRHRKAKRKQKR